MSPLAPMPRAPRRRYRDIEEHGHHHFCSMHDDALVDSDSMPWCRCWELDEEDYHAACEEKYDAWRNGDYD